MAYLQQANTLFLLNGNLREEILFEMIVIELKNGGIIKLEIGKEIYHENGLACKSLLMKYEYETCYQN